MDDWKLLQDYAQRNSEGAFRTLFSRHINLVYSVALRHVHDDQLAQEVAQAVFILLARKANGFRHNVILSGWLFRTTRFVAGRAVRAEQRRQRREQEAFAMQQLTTTDDTWKRISPALDEALERLGETDRNALLLRFFNDKSHRETAAALGVSEDAAKKRVTRALDKLRNFFAGRGVTLSAAVLASAMIANGAKAATPEITASISAKVIASGSAGAGILPPLVNQTLNAWRWAKLKLAGALASTVAVAVVIGFVLIQEKPSNSPLASGNKQSPPVAIDAGSPASTTRTSRVSQIRKQDDRILRLSVVARDTSDAVPNAQLALIVVADGKWKPRFDLLTDENGLANVPYPPSTRRIDVGLLSGGWAARFAEWKSDSDPAIPGEYRLVVDRVTNSMGGWLRDEQGQPVANAEVEMLFSYSDMAQRETPRERPGFLHPTVVARSDQNGWWTCAVLDPKGDRLPGLAVRHTDFAPTEIVPRQWASDSNSVQQERAKLLWAGKLVTTMARGLTLMGTVLDEEGRAIAGAQVVHEPASMRLDPTRAETESNGDGRFDFRGLKSGDFDFIVTAPGFAQEYRKVSVRDEMPPIEVRLKPGGLLRLRVVDEQGDAVSNARAALTGAVGMYAPEGYWSAESGSDGCIEWNSAPRDRVLNLCASKYPDWLMTRGIMVEADGQEHVITLRRVLLVKGRVTDAQTGDPISEVKAFPGYGLGDNCWYRGETWRSTNNTFQVRFIEDQSPWRVCVEAEGYAPFVSKPLTREFSGPFDVALHRPDPAKAVRGVILRPDGQAASGAEVALLTLEHGAWLGRARFAYREPGDKLIVNSDAGGHFVFSPDPMALTVHTIIAVSGDGFARVRVRDPKEPLAIRLQPWGRVEGIIDPSARRRPVDAVVLDDRTFLRSLRLDGAAFRLQPGERNDFSFDFVPPETFCVWLSAGAGIPHPEHHHTWVTVLPGTTTHIKITETGCFVKGRLIAIGGEGDWTRQAGIGMEYEDTQILGLRIPSRRYYASRFAKLIPDMPRPNSPPEFTYEDSMKWAAEYWSSEAVRGPVPMDAILAVSEDGSFESLEGVQPGTYRLEASVNGKRVQRKIMVLNLDGFTSSVVDLGDIPVGDKTTSAGPVAPTATGLNQ